LQVISPEQNLHFESNGAHIRNKLSNQSPSPVPDTAAQIQTYLTDLAKYVQHPISGKVFDGRILHALWIGINPILGIWRSASSGNQTLNADALLTPELAETLNTQVEEFSKQLLQLLNNPSLSKSVLKYFSVLNLLNFKTMHSSRSL
jgi:hypothetical protein